MLKKIVTVPFLVTFAGLMAIFAQDVPKTISGGVVNGKAIVFPEPVYPPEAEEEGASGEVKVSVLINEQGNVVSAQAVSGHPFLRKTAEQAAWQAKFNPTILSGVPVKVIGVIVYNFALPEKDGNEESAELPPIINHKATDLPEPLYPPAALAVRAKGSVKVLVTVDEKGNVISAEAVSGHSLLRAAAVEATQNAKFEPELLEGVPVRFSGIIVYIFFLPKPIPQGSSSETDEPQTLSAGLIGGKALSLPKPPYPQAAREAGASGSVTVSVLVDVDGSVLEAKAFSGNPLLYEASETAARAAKFAPTTVSGKPVRIRGFIVYNYVP